MTSIAEYLTNHAFFADLDDEYIAFLADSAEEKQLREHEVLFSQGKNADRFYMLRSGSVAIEIPALVGPVLEVQLLGVDQVLGWSWLIPPYKWNFLARAKQESTVIEFDGSAIRDRCEADPKFGYELYKRFASLMSERLDAARQKLMDQWNPAGFA